MKEESDFEQEEGKAIKTLKSKAKERSRKKGLKVWHIILIVVILIVVASLFYFLYYYDNEVCCNPTTGITETGRNVSINSEGEGEIVIYHEHWSYSEKSLFYRKELKGTFRKDRSGEWELAEGTIIFYYGNEKDKWRREEGTFKGGRLHGQGEIVFYYENGNKDWEKKGIFKNRNLIKGEKIWYYENGNKKMKKEEHLKDMGN